MILFISIAYSEKTSITAKQVFSSLSYSYSAVRLHYNRLLKEGYLIHKLDNQDKRIKYIEPTRKLLQTIACYTNDAKVIVETFPP